MTEFIRIPKKIIFVCNARDYHAMDWYHSIKKLYPSSRIIIVTDLIEGEGYQKLITDNDEVYSLFKIDKFLFSTQSVWGNKWRNLLKLLFLPMQLLVFKRLRKKYPDAVVHAHTMYYMLLCYLSKISFIGTPQGSEILVRPRRSRIYKYFAKRSLQVAKIITVDSVNMADKIFEMVGKRVEILQNGIDCDKILSIVDSNVVRESVISIRGMARLYQIADIVKARDNSETKPPLRYIYPFCENDYEIQIKQCSSKDDRFLARLAGKTELYREYNKALLTISIPISDSSPRSVYEAIFCGCCVAVTYNKWIDILPNCMRKRLFIINLNDNLWFDKALSYAKRITKIPYKPSLEAIEKYDQYKIAEFLVKKIYTQY